MEPQELLDLLARQDGVINRRQCLDCGVAPADVRRMLRRREWARVHPGVYVDHTGPLTWRQRAWAAVLFAEPAALCEDSALRSCDGPGRRDRDEDGPIHVAIDKQRQSRAPQGVLAHRVSGLTDKVLWNLSPPRVRIEEAVIDVAAGARDDLAAIAVIGDAVGSRRTTADRILRALDRRTRLSRRRFLAEVLTDVSAGACSALEHRYLTRVERAHGLPAALRQVRASSRGTIYRDVLYARLNTVVELDGRLDHTRVRDRDRDLERDLDAVLDELLTIRLGWGQVVGRPCLTASKLGQALQQRGWHGSPERCADCGDDGGDSGSPGGSESPRSA